MKFLLQLNTFVSTLLVLEVYANANENIVKTCTSPLLANEKLLNSSFRSSTDWNEFVSSYARMDPRDEDVMHAWCPVKKNHGLRFSDWLEIDLGSLHMITMIQTMGRKAKSQGREFTSEFRIEYKREHVENFRVYRTREKIDILKGNDGATNPSINQLDPVIIARLVRVYPDMLVDNHVCLKLELIGCVYEDRLVEYQIPQGDIFDYNGVSTNYTDDVYDGKSYAVERHSYLRAGLGKLVDNHIDINGPGPTQEQISPRSVGWDSSHNSDKITLKFRFESIRNFSLMCLHLSNAFHLLVRLPRLVTVQFMVQRQVGLQPKRLGEMNHTIARDNHLTSTRWVNISLNHRVANLLSVDLHFDDAGDVDGLIALSTYWIMLSEVLFESEALPANYVTRTSSMLLPSKENLPWSLKPNLVNLESSQHAPPGEDKTVAAKENSYQPSESYNVIIIVCCLVGFLVLLLIMAIMLTQRRRCNKKSKLKHNVSVTAIKDDERLQVDIFDGHSPSLINGKSLINSFSIYTSLPNSEDEEHQVQQHPSQRKMVEGAQEYACTNLYGKHFNTSPWTCSTSMGVSTLPLGLTMASTGRGVAPLLPTTTFSTLSCQMTRNNSANVALLHKHAAPALQRNPSPPLLPPLNMRFPPQLSMQGICGTTMYSTSSEAGGQDTQSATLVDLRHLEVPRSRIKFGERFGECQFCELFVGRLTSSSGSFEDAQDVMVKMQRANVSVTTKREFLEEISMLVRLNSPHVSSVLGMVSSSNPLCVLVEYAKYGDLCRYLQSQAVAATDPSRLTERVSYGSLLYMARQIATGMKYMASLDLVHRDLAARNCLVGENWEIKVYDSAMTSPMFAADYYQAQGCPTALPIRWMACETVLLGQFSHKSDVWAFGVTLWEILNYCQFRPFSHLTDEEVIRNCGHIYANDGCQECLSCPTGPCRTEIYDLMRTCWQRDQSGRPSFQEIEIFLQRKCVGYSCSLSNGYDTTCNGESA